MSEEQNSIVDIKKFLEGDVKITMAEFKEFWDSLSEEEKLEFKQAELPQE